MAHMKRAAQISEEGDGRPALVRTRVRAYVPRDKEFVRHQAEYPRPNDRALVVHVLTDHRDRLTLATSRELSGYVGIDELLFASSDQLPGLIASMAGQPPDVPMGTGARLTVLSIEKLGRLISRRFYRRPRIPLVVWDMGWTLGRLAAHAGRLKGSSDGFSVTLVGCGTYNVEGKWRDSDHHPRYELKPQGVGQLGVFVSCGLTFEEKRAFERRRDG